MSDSCISKVATAGASGFGIGSLVGAMNATWQVRQPRTNEPFFHPLPPQGFTGTLPGVIKHLRLDGARGSQ